MVFLNSFLLTRFAGSIPALLVPGSTRFSCRKRYNGANASLRGGGGGADGLDGARGVDAALEEHQQQHIQKSKGKGKKKAAVFSSLLADEEDDDDVHHTLRDYGKLWMWATRP